MQTRMDISPTPATETNPFLSQPSPKLASRNTGQSGKWQTFLCNNSHLRDIVLLSKKKNEKSFIEQNLVLFCCLFGITDFHFASGI